MPTEREWNILKELVEILNPFAQATDLLQGDKVVTISAVVPSILSLNHHLERLKTSRDKYLMSMINALQKAVKQRFVGVFVKVRMLPDVEGPFSDEVYLLSALLDPTFGMMCITRR